MRRKPGFTKQCMQSATASSALEGYVARPWLRKLSRQGSGGHCSQMEKMAEGGISDRGEERGWPDSRMVGIVM